MKRLLLTLLLAGFPATLLGQYGPYDTYSEPAARNRRALREKAVVHARGVQPARAMVEGTDGDDAAKALLNCTKETAAKLAEFHSNGGFNRIPRARDLFNTIAQQKSGNDIAEWVIAHPEELADGDAVSAFLTEPMTFVLALKKLSAAAAEIRARRFEVEKTEEAKTTPEQKRSFWITPLPFEGIAALAIVIGVPLFAVWRWRKRSVCDMPA